MATKASDPFSNQCGELNPGPWNMLAAMLPTANWTADADTGRVTRAVAAREADVYDRLARALFRRERRHVLLTGDKGVGKTAVVHSSTGDRVFSRTPNHVRTGGQATRGTRGLMGERSRFGYR